MTANDWLKQGQMLGSLITVKDWEMNKAASLDPGTVQIHIQRSLDKAAADINRKEGCLPCNYKPELSYHEKETEVIALRTYLTTLAF